MGSSSRAASAPDSIPSSKGLFFFDADGATAQEVARAVAEHWGVSVLLPVEIGKAGVTGRIVTSDLRAALDALALFAGVPWREKPGSGVYFYGGKEEKIVASLPAYGLQAGEIGAIGGGNARVVADRVIIDAPPATVAQVRETLEGFRDRPSVILEVFVLDVSTNVVDRVNAWLDSVRIGGGYMARSALVGATGGAGAGLGSLQSVAGPTWDVDVRGLFDLLEVDRSARVELRQQAQILSGSQTRFESGEVQERELITREPETGQDLVSSIERRTIGLTMTLNATAFPGGWQLRVDFQDSDRSGGTERTTSFRGERRILDGEEGFFLLASFNRKSDVSSRRAVPVLGSGSGWLARQFQKREAVRGQRSVMVLGRRIAAGAKD